MIVKHIQTRIVIKIIMVIIFLLCVFLVLFAMEWLAYYLDLVKCSWPKLDTKNEDKFTNRTNHDPLHVMVISDTHLLGSHEGYWIDKIRTEWEMYMMFQIALKLHRPDVVFVLGDLTTEGEYCEDFEFDGFIKRFYSSFVVPKNTEMHVVVGNHDIGFHYRITSHKTIRFDKSFNTTAARLMTIRGNHFVLINSIALEKDDCFLCSVAEQQITAIENALNCSKYALNCKPKDSLGSYSRPVILQHFPLYRSSDINCSEPDEAPYFEKIEPFKEAWDCLSKVATDMLLRQLHPRLVIDGHTHHGCTTELPTKDGVEITIPSFNWRYKNNPSYGLVCRCGCST